MEKESLKDQFNYLCDCLLTEKNPDGFWSGRLSSSALSTATSMVALQIHGNSEDRPRIQSGYTWLKSNLNSDGGFGDTPGSESNVSTSLLCYAAVYYCQSCHSDSKEFLSTIENFLETKGISLTNKDIASAVLKFYGSDYTFSVPILSMLSLCGVLSDEAFRHIPGLPFELSLVPASWYRFFNLQVVSYAIPALIGVGIYIHSRRKAKFSLPGLYRRFAIEPAIRKLAKLLPESGGFLEAIPLTAFVNMCLVASGHPESEVVKRGIVFLRNQQRTDGSWPIDTDLSTWVTTLSIKALGSQVESVLGREAIQKVKKHLLTIQYKEKHPYNRSKPGGWGWTSFSGSVPDADDTAGAVLALLEMVEGTPEETSAIMNGCIWLAGLQNSDGGFPTFCKGWGGLPFDSSCADLTGHAILAFANTMERLGDKIPASLQKRFSKIVLKAVAYLLKYQAADGHWIPLWFGSQLTADKKNPVYGTAKVCIYLEDCLGNSSIAPQLQEKLQKMVGAAQQYLLSQQNPDGSWGAQKDIEGSIEETALAISALAKTHPDVCLKGFEWLADESRNNTLNPSPIGLYFATLWYTEKMYPVVFYIEALRRAGV